MYFQCDMAVGSKLFFDMMHDAPPKLMLFGGACSQVTAPIAESSPYWNITQVPVFLFYSSLGTQFRNTFLRNSFLD